MLDSFKEKGLLKIVLPRERITPLMIIQKQDKKKGEIIGTIEELFDSTSVALSLNNIDEKASEFSGDNTAKMNFEAGFNFLQGIWSKLGKGELSGNFKKDDLVTFSFKNLLRDSIKSEIELKRFVFTSITSMKEDDPYRQPLIDGELYIVTSVLKSNDFQIAIHDEKKGEAKFDFNIKELLDTTFKAGSSDSTKESIVNNGGYMVFALRAKKIFYKEGNWLIKGRFSLEDPDIDTVLSPENKTNDLLTEDGYIDFG
jgi:hypothetical protein